MLFKRLLNAAFLIAIVCMISFAQTPREPNQQKLLNGLKVLTWTDPGASKVQLKIRIHSGSAFDPKDKMGVMALLADILFPSEQSREFFRDDLEGNLEILSTYDYIQINASGKSEEFLTIVETIANAVSNPSITQENFLAVRNQRAKLLTELNSNAAYVADRMVAQRLLGDFPYGRAQEGTPESLKRIDRTDLITARDRFLTADNATIAITGNVKPDAAYRAVRRLFGGWKRSDKLSPSTFRLPDSPNPDSLTIEMENVDTAQIRVAIRGFARNEKDFAASQLLARILEEKYFPMLSPEFRTDAKISNDVHFLPGVFRLSLSTKSGDISHCSDEVHKISKVRGMITSADLESARRKLMTEMSVALGDLNSVSEFWLDVDTFKLAPIKDQLKSLNSVTLSDILRIHDRVMNMDAPRAFVLVVPKHDAASSTVNQ